jgi:hypothetical protein
MKTRATFRLLSLFFLAATTALAAPPDFNGTWKLDLTRSQLPGHPNLDQSALDQVLTIKLDDSTLSVSTQTTSEPAGKVTTSDTYALDGKPHDYTPATRTGSSAAKGIRTASRTEDRAAIVILEAITRGTGGDAITVHNTHTWTLSTDGQTLTVVTIIHTSQGEISTTRVFAREPAPAP